MENEKQALEAIRKEIYASAPYIVNDKQLAQVVETYLTSTTQDKLFIFGHTGIGKTDIVRRMAEQNNCVLRDYIFSADAELKITDEHADVIEIQCHNIRDLYKFPQKILSLNLPCKIIVEVAVNYEGDVRNFIRQNHDTFKWVYYRESPEDVLSYMKETNIDPMILNFLTEHPEKISGFQTKECEKFQEGMNLISRGMECIEQHTNMNQVTENLINGMQHLILATISDKPIRNIAQQISSILWQNKDEIEDSAMVLQLGMLFSRDMPYVESYYREI